MGHGVFFQVTVVADLLREAITPQRGSPGKVVRVSGGIPVRLVLLLFINVSITRLGLIVA